MPNIPELYHRVFNANLLSNAVCFTMNIKLVNTKLVLIVILNVFRDGTCAM